MDLERSKILLDLQIKFNQLAEKALQDLSKILDDASEPFRTIAHRDAARLIGEGEEYIQSVIDLIGTKIGILTYEIEKQEKYKAVNKSHNSSIYNQKYLDNLATFKSLDIQYKKDYEYIPKP
jgi:hypothetical protein